MPIKKKFFGTDGIRGRVGVYPINAEFFLKLGWATGRVFAQQGYAKVLIGKDTRVSGYMFEAALEAGLSAAGADSRLVGPMPTPAVAYLTRTLRANAGIVISASHNRYEDNGIKFFSADGFKLPDEIELAIEMQIEKPMDTVHSYQLGKAKRINDAPGRYIEFCKSTIGTAFKLNGLKIVIDCAHGATYHIAPAVLTELGANVVLIGDQPDGFNINEECGSTNLDALRQKVLQTKADLGIAFDGDGDRAMMVTECGSIVNGDDILYVCAKERLLENRLNGGVVGTVMSNAGLFCAFEQLKLPFIRAQVGDRYVLNELLQQKWLLGGEPSGHVINLDLNTTGDGIITALQVLKALSKMNKSLETVCSEYEKYPQKMVNITIPSGCEPLKMKMVQDKIATAQKALAGKGRVLVRTSGTEPLIRVMAEAQDVSLVDEVVIGISNVVHQAVNLFKEN